MIAPERFDIGKKRIIAEPISNGNGFAEFPKTKGVLNEFRQLLKATTRKPSRRKEYAYLVLQGIHYDKPHGVLVATNGHQLKLIKVGDLDGFDSGYVDIDTGGKSISVKYNEEMTKRFNYPNWTRVIPNEFEGKVLFYNKVLANKLKEMKASGMINKKCPGVCFGFKTTIGYSDGDVVVNGTTVGTIIGHSVNEGDFFIMNPEYLLNAISGITSEMSIQSKLDKSMMINTGCSASIIMPVLGSNARREVY